jgi:hypothetical protein
MTTYTTVAVIVLLSEGVPLSFMRMEDAHDKWWETLFDDSGLDSIPDADFIAGRITRSEYVDWMVELPSDAKGRMLEVFEAPPLFARLH